ncbi:MAG: outer membrane protein assembly factor BamD [Polyangiaceae bacterium]
MHDPQRLLSSTSVDDDLERELLASIKKAEPPFGAKNDGWARLSAQIAAVALVSTAHGSAAASVTSVTRGAPSTGGVSAGSAVASLAVRLLSRKLAVAVAISGIAIGASTIWVHSAGPPKTAAVVAPKVSAPTPPPTLTTALVSAPPAPDPALQLAPIAEPSAKQARLPSAARIPQDRLSAESALLLEARASLRNGDANAAQQTLNELRVKFPKGVLRQEREVLAIEVLSARGDKEAARHRAEAFIAAYPESPHSARLSRFADAP